VVARLSAEADNGAVDPHARTGQQGPRHVVVVAYDGVRFLDVVGPLEVFTVANEQGDFYVAQVATPGRRDVTTTTGNRLGADAALEEIETDDIDTLIVAGSPNWKLLLDPTVVAGVRRLAEHARRVVSVCTGTFALAAAGIVDGRRVATHWRHAGALQREFPAVEVAPESLFVCDGNVFTSAGIAAGMDLALALVEDDLGPDIARTSAKILVVFLQRPGGQSQFSTWTTSRPVRNEPLRQVLDSIALDPAADHTLEAMAKRANFSVRHLSRLFDDHVGMSAGQYVEHVRVEAVKVMLESGDEGLATIAKRTGFGSVETMRRAFLRDVGTSPGAYRERFRTTGINTTPDTPGRPDRWPAAAHRVPVSAPVEVAQRT
jgi:transcriptional regulator GlxA family with amidase domain